MTWYIFFKFVHVACAVLWIGGGTMLQLLSLRALKSRSAERRATFAADAEWVGMRLFMPSTLLLILAALGMMFNAALPWDQAWILYPLGVYITSFVVGAGFLGPESGRISKLIETEGAGSPDAERRIRRVLLLSRIELVLLLGVTFDMVVKPTLDYTWTIVVVTAVSLVAIALIHRAYRREQVGVPGAAAADSI
ncbi:MAG: hypothetical protein QOE36_2367 [Gaiellaceae bacterium]|jgi:uncharacterized membrane protein|nr:hypothetical protein [Gaiellaceae bacterium]